MTSFSLTADQQDFRAVMRQFCEDKISPRAGFAWDIKGDARWKGYGSFGIFYDTSKLEMPRGLFGSEHSVTYYMTLDTFDWQSIQCAHPPTPGPNCPGTYIEQVDFRHAANEVQRAFSLYCL